jgi:hypothetical protein
MGVRPILRLQQRALVIEKLAHVRERVADREAQQRVAVSLPRCEPFLNLALHEGIDTALGWST